MKMLTDFQQKKGLTVGFLFHHANPADVFYFTRYDPSGGCGEIASAGLARHGQP